MQAYKPQLQYLRVFTQVAFVDLRVARYRRIQLRCAIVLLLSPLFGHAQILLKGKVLNKESGNPIPYATVGLKKQNSGTNADEQGFFTIASQHPNQDSLIISCVGYITMHIAVSDAICRPEIFLSASAKTLRTVIVKDKWTYKEAGTYKKHQEYCYTTSGFQWQVAKKMSAPSANAQLQSLHVRLSKHNNGSSMFRLHIYQFDSLTRGPGKELTDTVIEVRSTVGMVSVDMTPYQIELPDKDFFVSLEWLRIPFNENYRNTKFEGKDTISLTYRPCIGFTRDASRSEEIWYLNYTGIWYRMQHEYPYSLAISATVKF